MAQRLIVYDGTAYMVQIPTIRDYVNWFPPIDPYNPFDKPTSVISVPVKVPHCRRKLSPCAKRRRSLIMAKRALKQAAEELRKSGVHRRMMMYAQNLNVTPRPCILHGVV